MKDFNPTKYKNEFNKEAYDRVSINFAKGQKAIIEQHWRKMGYKSLNTYVNELIRRDMNEPAEEKSASKNIKIENNKGVVIGENNNGTINLKK